MDALTGLVFLSCLIVAAGGLYFLSTVLFEEVYNSILSLIFLLPLVVGIALVSLTITYFVTAKIRQKLGGTKASRFFLISSAMLSLSVATVAWAYGVLYDVPAIWRVLVVMAIVIVAFVVMGRLQAASMRPAVKWLIAIGLTALVLYFGLSYYRSTSVDVSVKSLQKSGLIVYAPESAISIYAIDGDASYSKGVSVLIPSKDDNKTLSQTKYTGGDVLADCGPPKIGYDYTTTYSCEQLTTEGDVRIFRKKETTAYSNGGGNHDRYSYTALIGSTQIETYQSVYSETDTRYPKPSQQAEDEQQLISMLLQLQPANEAKLKELVTAAQK